MKRRRKKTEAPPIRCEPCPACPFANGKDHEAQEAEPIYMLCHESQSLDDVHADGIDFLCAGWHA